MKCNICNAPKTKTTDSDRIEVLEYLDLWNRLESN